MTTHLQMWLGSRRSVASTSSAVCLRRDDADAVNDDDDLRKGVVTGGAPRDVQHVELLIEDVFSGTVISLILSRDSKSDVLRDDSSVDLLSASSPTEEMLTV